MCLYDVGKGSSGEPFAWPCLFVHDCSIRPGAIPSPTAACHQSQAPQSTPSTPSVPKHPGDRGEGGSIVTPNKLTSTKSISRCCCKSSGLILILIFWSRIRLSKQGSRRGGRAFVGILVYPSRHVWSDGQMHGYPPYKSPG